MNWEATLRDGTTVTGETHEKQWPTIQPHVVDLRFVRDGVTYGLPRNMKEYLYAKSASAAIPSGRVVIESRWIGCRLGNGQIMRLRFHERDNRVDVEVE